MANVNNCLRKPFVMNENRTPGDRRTEARTTSDRYYSVQISKQEFEADYQFRIRNISPKGMCILVREDSLVMEHLHVGDILDMKFYPLNDADPVEKSKTEIIHIFKDQQGRFKGHYLVGLAILPDE